MKEDGARQRDYFRTQQLSMVVARFVQLLVIFKALQNLASYIFGY